MKIKKIVVDSDIIAEHVLTENYQSVLRKLSKEYFCYTTVFNAIELFSLAESLKERQAIENAMSALKVLGINGKSAKNIAAAISSTKKDFPALIAGVCLESRLPIATMREKRYTGIKKLQIKRINK